MNGLNRFLRAVVSPLTTLAVIALAAPASSQPPELQQKVAAIKEAAAQNKQALAQYTWTEQVTISLKGEQKKQEHFQVRLGPDGKPQKTPLDAPAQAQAPSGRQGRLKEHVVEKKKEEYKEYADSVKGLIEQYVPPDKERIEQARQQGNISLKSDGSLVIANYLKQGDSITLRIDKGQKDLASVSIASYLDDPKDSVSVDVTFDRIPNGPNHIASETINCTSKQMVVAVQNSNYQHL